MKKRELRQVISGCYKQLDEYWKEVSKNFEDSYTLESIVRDEPNSQFAKMVCWLYALDDALDSDEEATLFETRVCDKLPRIIETLNELVEDHDTFK